MHGWPSFCASRSNGESAGGLRAAAQRSRAVLRRRHEINAGELGFTSQTGAGRRIREHSGWVRNSRHSSRRHSRRRCSSRRRIRRRRNRRRLCGRGNDRLTADGIAAGMAIAASMAMAACMAAAAWPLDLVPAASATEGSTTVLAANASALTPTITMLFSVCLFMKETPKGDRRIIVDQSIRSRVVALGSESTHVGMDGRVPRDRARRSCDLCGRRARAATAADQPDPASSGRDSSCDTRRAESASDNRRSCDLRQASAA